MVPVAQEVDCYPPGKSLSGADSSTVQRITRLDSDLFDCVTCFYGFSYSISATRVSYLDLGHVHAWFFFTPSGKVVGSGDDIQGGPVPTI